MDPTMEMTRRLVVWIAMLGLVAGLVAPSRAVAQPASVQAQALFDSGRKLMAAGKFADACTAFESSQQLDPAVSTLLNLADCREQNRQLATAWGVFLDANRMARNTNNERFAKVANNHARALEPRLSRLAISVPASHQVPGLEILRGSELVNPAAWNNPLPIDGGTYTITARAPGRATWKTVKTIKFESDNVTVEIPALSESRSDAVAATAAPSRPGTPPIKPAEPSSTRPVVPRPGEPSSTGPAPPRPGEPSSTGPRPSEPSSTGPASPRPSEPSSTGRRPSEPASATPASPRPREPSSTMPVSSRPSEPSIARPAPTRPSEPTAKPTTAGAEISGTAPTRLPDPVVDDPPRAGSRVPVVPLALGAGALVLGGTAIGFHFWGDQAYDKAKASMVQSERDKLVQSANHRRYAAQGFGLAGVACAGAAVYLYLRDRRADRGERVAVLPVASPQFAGLAVAGGW